MAASIYWRWLYPLEPDSAKRVSPPRQRAGRPGACHPAQPVAGECLRHALTSVRQCPGQDPGGRAPRSQHRLEKDAYLGNADAIINRLTHAAYDLAQFPDADKWCREGQRRFPADARFVECELLIMTSKFVEADPARAPARAWLLADSVVRLTPDERDKRYERLYARVLVAGVLARAGLRDSAQGVLA